MNSRLLKLLALLAGVGVGAFAMLHRRARDRAAEGTAQPKSLRTPVMVVEQPPIQPKRASWKRWLLRLGGLGAVLAIVSFLVAASGILPIKASSGHWAITRWFLQFSKSRSIATHTIGMKTPALDEPWMLMKGAGHYETGCAPCHGSPLRKQPRVAEHMLPRPPQLKYISSKRDDAELFYIVKHGIKLTGMPAWPAMHRDDEVSAMVAFLRRLPDIDSEEYRRLAGGKMSLNGGVSIQGQPHEKMPRAVFEDCGRCHGVDGMGRGTGAYPKLAGQKFEYLLGSLQAYARAERHSGVMGPIAAGLSREAMRELATYYGNLQPQRSAPVASPDAQAIERGRAIATQGIPRRRVPACVECHGPRATPRNRHYPVLAGQYADYVVLQLELFSKQHRGGTPYAHLMRFVAGNLTPEQMRDVAVFFESLTDNNGTLTITK